MLQISMTEKKVDYIFEEPFNLQLLISFFSLPLWIPGENSAKLKNLYNLNIRLRWVAQYPKYTEYTYYFLISNCCMQVIFEPKIVSALFLIAGIHSTANSNNEQMIIFYSPPNAFCSSDESVQIKHFKNHTFISMRSLARCFYSLTLIHSQNEKKPAHYSWDIYQENLTTKFNKVLWWAFWVGDPRNFDKGFFVENYYWTSLF